MGNASSRCHDHGIAIRGNQSFEPVTRWNGIIVDKRDDFSRCVINSDIARAGNIRFGTYRKFDLARLPLEQRITIIRGRPVDHDDFKLWIGLPT